MILDEAALAVKKELTNKRYEHTLRVVDEATKLAHNYGANVDDVQLSAMFHDYAKDMDKQFLRDKIMTSDLSNDLLNYHEELWHGPVASVLVEERFHIRNKGIQSAIKYHTTGKQAMSVVDEIVFLADYIEPERSFQAVSEVREHTYKELTFACWIVCRTYIHVLTCKRGFFHTY